MVRTKSGLTNILSAGVLTAITAAGCSSQRAQSLSESHIDVAYKQHTLDSALVEEEKLPFNFFSRDKGEAIEYKGNVLNQRLVLNSKITPLSNVRVADGKDELKDEDNVYFLTNAYYEGDQLLVNLGRKPKETGFLFANPPEIHLEPGEAIERRVYQEAIKRLRAVDPESERELVSLYAPNPYGPNHVFVDRNTISPLIEDEPRAGSGATTVKIYGIQGVGYFPVGPVGDDVRLIPSKMPRKAVVKRDKVEIKAPELPETIRGITGYKEVSK
jgi:hypothetical protein